MKSIIKHCTSCCLALAMATALLATLASCSKEEATDDTLPPGKYPINFTATMQGLTVQKAASRATTVNIWDGNEEVAVKIGSEVKKYTAATDGTLTVGGNDVTPWYWQNTTEQKTVSAWHPHSTAQPTTFTVKQDQSGDGYQNSDMIYVAPTIVSFRSNALTFKHLPVKVVVNLKNGDGVTESDVQNATVSIENQATTSGTIAADWSVAQTTTGSSAITPNMLTTPASGYQKSVQALLVPQQMQNKKFIKVTINSNDYYYTPTNATDANLASGKQYTYTITVKKNELVVSVTDNGATWTDSEQDSGPAQTAKFHIRGGNGMTLTAGDGGPLTDKSGYKELSGTNLLKVTVAKQNGKFLKGISISGISVLQSWKSDGTNYEIIYQLKGDVALTSDFVDKPTPVVGNYYYADGEWSTELWSKPCIGIVFKAGKDNSDDENYTDMNGTTMSTINGYVVALEDANSGTLAWANKNSEYSVNVSTPTSDSDWKGYSNTQTIKIYTTDGWSIEYFPAANACLDFGTTFPKYAAPGSSSGWFLPSCGQLSSLYSNREILSGKIGNLKRVSGYEDIKWFIGYWYWSSSENGFNAANFAWGVNFDDGGMRGNNKGSGGNVRGVFAF